MCLAFVLFDLALIFAAITLTLWILAFTAVIPLAGSFIHIFLVIAIILLIVWIVFRLFNVGGYHDYSLYGNGGDGYGYGYRRRNL